jgi:hypothetical protein
MKENFRLKKNICHLIKKSHKSRKKKKKKKLRKKKDVPKEEKCQILTSYRNKIYQKRSKWKTKVMNMKYLSKKALPKDNK